MCSSLNIKVCGTHSDHCTQMGKSGFWSNQIQAVPTRRGEAGANNWGPTMVHMVLFLSSIITCQLYKLTLSNQAHVSPQLTASHSE